MRYLQGQVTDLLEAAEPGTDMDVRVLEAYINQSQAEAQEVTIARAIELKHSPSLVSGLCAETSKMFKLGGMCNFIYWMACRPVRGSLIAVFLSCPTDPLLRTV